MLSVRYRTDESTASRPRTYDQEVHLFSLATGSWTDIDRLLTYSATSHRSCKEHVLDI